MALNTENLYTDTSVVANLRNGLLVLNSNSNEQCI